VAVDEQRLAVEVGLGGQLGGVADALVDVVDRLGPAGVGEQQVVAEALAGQAHVLALLDELGAPRVGLDLADEVGQVAAQAFGLGGGDRVEVVVGGGVGHEDVVPLVQGVAHLRGQVAPAEGAEGARVDGGDGDAGLAVAVRAAEGEHGDRRLHGLAEALEQLLAVGALRGHVVEVGAEQLGATDPEVAEQGGIEDARQQDDRREQDEPRERALQHRRGAEDEQQAR
jgi:hypothetical protein